MNNSIGVKCGNKIYCTKNVPEREFWFAKDVKKNDITILYSNFSEIMKADKCPNPEKIGQLKRGLGGPTVLLKWENY